MRQLYLSYCWIEDCFLTWCFEEAVDNRIITFVAMLICVALPLKPLLAILATALLTGLPFMWWDLRTPKS